MKIFYVYFYTNLNEYSSACTVPANTLKYCQHKQLATIGFKWENKEPTK